MVTAVRGFLQALGFPMAHALTKNPGDPVTARWDAQNTRLTVGYVRLQVNVDSQFANGPNTAAPPGATVQNQAIIFNLSQAGGLTYAGSLVMLEVDINGTQIAEIARHNFTVTVLSIDPTADLNWVQIGTLWTSPPANSRGQRETFLLTSYRWYSGTIFAFIMTYTGIGSFPDYIIPAPVPGVEMTADAVRTISTNYEITLGTGETFLDFKRRVGAI